MQKKKKKSCNLLQQNSHYMACLRDLYTKTCRGKRAKPNKPYTVASKWDLRQNPELRQTSEKEYEKSDIKIQSRRSF